MTGRKTVGIGIVVVALLTLFVATGSAQGIAGVVKDSGGGVLPGVLVEATSPALIEKSRSVVTDGEGQYKFVDLRVGTYSVSFTLAGFRTVRRDGIELSGGFTATINAEMPVGELEETIVVTGSSPVVDVQNVVAVKVVNATTMDALPSGRNLADFSQLIPGITISSASKASGQDVGGLTGERQLMMIHGSRTSDQTLMMDGLLYNMWQSGGNSATSINPGMVQEFAYEIGAISSEGGPGGIRLNIIPKEGGNSFSGVIFANYANRSMTSDNLTPDLQARGLTAVNRMQRIFDYNPSFGGRIVRDRLWFYGSVRYWGYDEAVAGKYYNSTPTGVVHTPDLSRPFITDNWNESSDLHLTAQMTSKHKLNVRLRDGWLCACHRIRGTANLAPESTDNQNIGPDRIGSVLWRAPLTNRLLVEAGGLALTFNENLLAHPGANTDLPAITELRTSLVYRAIVSRFVQVTRNNTFRASLSYVTGSQSLRVGAYLQRGHRKIHNMVDGNLNLQFLDGAPRNVVVWATPYDARENVNAVLGVFAQEQWQLKRLTVNMGVRFDYLDASEAALHLPAVQFMRARDFAAVSDIPSLTDLSPRLGISYDPFGTGKTAIKASLSRYTSGGVIDVTSASAPVNASVNSTTRTWNDNSFPAGDPRNANFWPDCDFIDPAVNGECGVGNPAFGQLNITTRYDEAVRKGFGNRMFNWETSVAIQHQLLPRMSVNIAYYRRSYGNLTVTDNLLVTPEDFDPYCITAPVDSRLPDGGGNQICGFYDVKPIFVQRSDNLITFAKKFGKQTEIYDGVDISADLRLPRGLSVAGGINTGRSKTNNCFAVDSPQQLKFCAVTPPFLTQGKLQVTYPLGWGMQAAATFQSNAPPNVLANYTATNAQVIGLGRNLAQGPNGSVTVPLVQPGTLYGERSNQIDVRLSKKVSVGKAAVTGMIDLYNALNANPVLVMNNSYSSASWQAPLYVLPGRMIKLGTQVTF